MYASEVGTSGSAVLGCRKNRKNTLYTPVGYIYNFFFWDDYIYACYNVLFTCAKFYGVILSRSSSKTFELLDILGDYGIYANFTHQMYLSTTDSYLKWILLLVFLNIHKKTYPKHISYLVYDICIYHIYTL